MTDTTVTAITAGQAITAGGNKQGAGLVAATNGQLAVTLGVADEDVANTIGTFEVTYDEGGVRTYADATFLVSQLVFADADGHPTQAVGAADTYRLLGVAVSTTEVLLLLPQIGIPRAAAAVRPMVIGDASGGVPRQATDADRALVRDYLGLGGPSDVQPLAHRDVTAEYVDDTHLKLKMMGDDGTVRSVTLTLA